MNSRCWTIVPLLTVALLASSLSTARAEHKVETLKEAPAGLAPEIAATLQPTGYRISSKEGTVCDVWLVKEVEMKPNFQPTLQVKYPFATGLLMGVIRFPDRPTTSDFRGQAITPGTYTLRYGWQPNDGNHLGTSEVRDFLLACPIKADTDPKRIQKMKELFALSAKAAGTTHPAIFLMMPPPEEAAEAPKVAVGDHDFLIFTFNFTGKAEDKTTPVPVNLVVAGESAG